jgi:RNA polymerase sigma-70 factor (ECF subfamily)
LLCHICGELSRAACNLATGKVAADSTCAVSFARTCLMPDICPASDESALLHAFVLHRKRLLSVARRILRCPHLAEDVVQDAVVKAARLDRERCIACPLNFACRIVRNLAIDRGRQRTLERGHAAPETLAETVEAPCGDPHARLEAGEALRLVLAALEELPERTRRVFERHRLQDVPQKTIATELGVSPTLVNFMVRDAHEHCRARLGLGGEAARASPRSCRRPGVAARSAPAAGSSR